MIEVPVYIPNPNPDSADADGLLVFRTLVPHSAIVGPSLDLAPSGVNDDIIVYFEGNKYGASNMITFADRAMFAYWRMRDRYPTVAMAGVKRRQLLRVGKLYPEHGRIEPLDARGLYQLHEWLGIPLDDGERLASELRCDGVRV